MSAAMASAAMSVTSARMTFAMMMVAVVVTLNIRVEDQLACQICYYSFISIAAASAHQLDACLSQCHLSAAADTAADEYIYFMSCKESAECTVTASFSRNNFA